MLMRVIREYCAEAVKHENIQVVKYLLDREGFVDVLARIE